MLAQETLLQLQKYSFDLLARQEPGGRRRLRYIALAHIKDGKSAAETALALRVTPRAVSQWLKWFIDEGLDRLEGIPHYWSTQRLPRTQEEAFRQAVEELQCSRGGGRIRGEDIRQLLAQQFGVDYTLNGVYELLKRLDMAWISARSVSPNADPLNVIAAVGLVLPYANTKTMALHLQEISQAVQPGRHAVLILDQAGWHTTPKLPQFTNITLLPLPAGSPGLNPAEQVWQQLRDRSLANRCYDS